MQEKILDSIDRKIIAILRENGRSKLVDLSKAIGFTSMGVKKRVAKIIEKNIVNVTATLNKSVLKFQLAFINVSISPQFSKEFVTRFEECPKAIALFARKNEVSKMFMLVFGETRGALSGLLDVARAQNGVVKAELQALDEVYYMPYLPIRVEKMLRDAPPCGASCNLCAYYQKNDCPGCPVSPDYRGPI
ncbi:MAG: Lrp/AsnC family transcriptional regulator [Candidatus Freyarchaeota archaeon]|nr:Lrp/AsnC family transcriptional regulator [Candidatus Jordarchaeia archaeon]